MRGLQHNLITLIFLVSFFKIANATGTPQSITFEENVGLHPGASQIVAHVSNFRVGFNNQSFHIHFRNESGDLDYLFIQFLNACGNANLVPLKKQKKNVSYNNGPDTTSWFERIPIFQQVKNDNI